MTMDESKQGEPRELTEAEFLDVAKTMFQSYQKAAYSKNIGFGFVRSTFELDNKIKAILVLATFHKEPGGGWG